MKKCLFICTGNYYRSRYAEAIFNYHALKNGLMWNAFSRGLAIHLAKGDLAKQTREMLEEKLIPLSMTGETRVQIHEHDFHVAEKVIALQHHEHYPMMASKFPLWADKIEYWDVADIEFVSARLALMRIEQLALKLVEELKSE
ncbi:MAG: low molecular weight phosphatase family protein [Verrucomicrobiota bacterium]